MCTNLATKTTLIFTQAFTMTNCSKRVALKKCVLIVAHTPEATGNKHWVLNEAKIKHLNTITNDKNGTAYKKAPKLTVDDDGGP